MASAPRQHATRQPGRREGRRRERRPPIAPPEDQAMPRPLPGLRNGAMQRRTRSGCSPWWRQGYPHGAGRLGSEHPGLLRRAAGGRQPGGTPGGHHRHAGGLSMGPSVPWAPTRRGGECGQGQARPAAGPVRVMPPVTRFARAAELATAFRRKADRAWAAAEAAKPKPQAAAVPRLRRFAVEIHSGPGMAYRLSLEVIRAGVSVARAFAGARRGGGLCVLSSGGGPAQRRGEHREPGCRPAAL